MDVKPFEDTKIDLKYPVDNVNIQYSSPIFKEPVSIAAFGNAAYAFTAFMSACANLELFKGNLTIFLAVATINGGLTQFICGFLEFKRGDVFGGTAFGAFGTYWLSFVLYTVFISPTTDPATKHLGEGYYLLMWCIFTAYMTIGSFKLSKVLFALFVTLGCTYLFLCIGTFVKMSIFIRLAAVAGYLSSACGFYLSAADIINSVFGQKAKKDE